MRHLLFPFYIFTMGINNSNGDHDYWTRAEDSSTESFTMQDLLVREGARLDQVSSDPRLENAPGIRKMRIERGEWLKTMSQIDNASS